MKTFIYDLVDHESGKILKKDVIQKFDDEWDVDSVELFCCGIKEDAVNVKEIDGARLAAKIIEKLEDEKEEYKFMLEKYHYEDRKEMLQWKIGNIGSLMDIYNYMRDIK